MKCGQELRFDAFQLPHLLPHPLQLRPNPLLVFFVSAIKSTIDQLSSPLGITVTRRRRKFRSCGISNLRGFFALGPLCRMASCGHGSRNRPVRALCECAPRTRTKTKRINRIQRRRPPPAEPAPRNPSRPKTQCPPQIPRSVRTGRRTRPQCSPASHGSNTTAARSPRIRETHAFLRKRRPAS